jgi:integrase
MPPKPQLRLPRPSYTGDLPAVPISVISFDRQFVDTRGDLWLVRQAGDGGDLLSISWRRFLYVCTDDKQTSVRIPRRTAHIARLYISDRLTRKAGYTLVGDLRSLHLLLQWLFNSEDKPGQSLQWAAMTESHLRGFLDHTLDTPNRGNDFHRVRVFFEWGVRQGISDFDPQLLRKIKTISAPGNLTGQHVRSQDPVKGPLYKEEIDLIVDALDKAAGAPQDRAIVMLFLELGLNPNQAARLRNEDLISFDGDINGAAHSEYQLRVPRNKKRRPFKETKQRAISQRLAELLKSLHKGKPVDSLLHWLPARTPSLGINEAFRRFVCKSNIMSPRTGGLLKLHARRLRYTLATEAAEQGASDYHVAELLDHSDISHVEVYRKTEPTIADRMERTLDPSLAPLVKRFQGQVVDSAGEYPFGKIPPAPIPGAAFHLPDYPLDLGGIGWCGLDLKTYGLCKKSPPLACYTCPKFAAWRDGPHKDVLHGLENATTALSEIADRRIPQELLDTKTAVQQCVQQIEGHTADTTDN